MKKSWWIAVFVAGLSASAPVLAHDTDWGAVGALHGGNPDLDRNGRVGPHDRGRIRREAAREEWRREEARDAWRREEARRQFAARARAKHRAYHRARAYEAAAEARAEAARAHYRR